jgi:nucleotide-binding universal stress UspA family protein
MQGMEVVVKNILVLVHDDGGQEARLQAALNVTRAVEGHLTCVDVAVMPVLVGDLYSGGGEIMLLQDERIREKANRETIEARLAYEGVNWNWIDTTGAIGPCLADQSALADLIVVNRKLDETPAPDMLAAASEALMGSGKPILAVPDSTRGFDVCGKALICWDGSPSCNAALRAAVPLLQLAKSVILYEVEDGSIATPADEAAAYMSRHDVSVTIRRERLHRERPAVLIADAIRHYAIDYVVMGGFSHNRFVEALLGGVTRAMLSQSPVPVFLAH